VPVATCKWLPFVSHGASVSPSKKASDCEHPLVSPIIATYDRHHSVQKVDGGDAVGPGPADLKKMKFCLVDRTHGGA
jgi:hypothetical protein